MLDNLLPLIWETQPERFPLTGTRARPRRAGLIVHSRYVERGVRDAGYAGPVWRIPHPAWPEQRGRARRRSTGDPLVGCFGYQNMNKRIPQLLEAFTLLRRAARARGCCSSASRPSASTSTAGSSGSGSAARR